MRSRPTIYTVLALALFAIGIGAQDKPQPEETSNSVAPVRWVRYEVAERKISFLFPKVPVVTEADNACEEVGGAVYQAYAEQVVYEFIWAGKHKAPMSQRCKSRKAFGPESYLRRVARLREQLGVTETTTTIGSGKATVFRYERPNHVTSWWLIWSIDEWVELVIKRRKENVVDEELILKAIEFKRLDGLPIGSGSPQIIGDLASDASANVKAPKTAPIVILSQPISKYTEAARKNKVDGTVTLKVTFLANGTIGPITVEKELPHGLTEQAIAAARRILFLPATEKGVPVDRVQPLNYSYSLY